MKDLSVNEILNRDAGVLVTESDKIRAEDKRAFLISQASRLYEESRRIEDSNVYIHRVSIADWIGDNLRLTVMIGGPTLMFILSAIVSN